MHSIIWSVRKIPGSYLMESDYRSKDVTHFDVPHLKYQPMCIKVL